MCKIIEGYPTVQREEKKKISEVLSCMDSPLHIAVKAKILLHFWTKIKHNQAILQHRTDFLV